MTDTTPTTARRTIRRYAHELYPHPMPGVSRPLAYDVAYLYARAIGFRLEGTSWGEVEPPAEGSRRVGAYIEAFRIALAADAMQQGLTGQVAWDFVNHRIDDEMEMAEERAYDVLTDEVIVTIKPYPCGPEPTRHEHAGPSMHGGWRKVVMIDGPESACDACTEPVVPTIDISTGA